MAFVTPKREKLAKLSADFSRLPIVAQIGGIGGIGCRLLQVCKESPQKQESDSNFRKVGLQVRHCPLCFRNPIGHDSSSVYRDSDSVRCAKSAEGFRVVAQRQRRVQRKPSGARRRKLSGNAQTQRKLYTDWAKDLGSSIFRALFLPDAQSQRDGLQILRSGAFNLQTFASISIGLPVYGADHGTRRDA